MRRSGLMVMSTWVILAARGGVEMADTQPAPSLELPEYQAEGGSGAYTGFNSVNLQEIYVVEKQPAVRSQIARGWGKPVLVRLPNGVLLASQYSNGGAECALCRSTDEGLTWSEPRLLGIKGRATQLAVTRDGALILSNGAGLHRSVDAGQTWTEGRIDWSDLADVPGDRIFSETNGPIQLPDGTLLAAFYVHVAPGVAKSYVIRSRDDGQTWGDLSYVGPCASS